jgi:hypothetical protein
MNNHLIFETASKSSKLAFVCATLQAAYEATKEEYFVEQFTKNWNEGLKLVDALSFHKMITKHSETIEKVMK